MGPIWMTLLLAAGWGVFAYSAQSRFRLLKCGSAENRCDRPGDRLRATWRYAIQQVRMRRYPLAGFAHMLVFLGFLVLLLRSLILWARGYSAGFSFWFLGSDQPLGKVYGLLKDLFAVLVIVGAVIFVYNRVVKRLPRLTLNTEGLIILAIIIVMMLADIFYDGASMVLGARAPQASLSFHLWEPAGSIAQYLVSILPTGAVNLVAHLGFWTHSALVLIFLNLLPYSKHFHIITGIPNVYLQNLAPPGRLRRPRISRASWNAARRSVCGESPTIRGRPCSIFTPARSAGAAAINVRPRERARSSRPNTSPSIFGTSSIRTRTACCRARTGSRRPRLMRHPLVTAVRAAPQRTRPTWLAE